MICYIFSTNKVLEIRLVVLIPLTTISKFNWQLCLKLTDPNFTWFNSQSTKKVLTLGLAFSYLRTSILSVFYDQCSKTGIQILLSKLETLCWLGSNTRSHSNWFKLWILDLVLKGLSSKLQVLYIIHWKIGIIMHVLTIL